MKLLILIVLSLLVLTACQSPESRSAHDEFAKAYDAAMADGVITATEATLLKELGDKWLEAAGKDTGSIPWEQLVGGSLATIVASIFGTNMYRNKGLPGSMRSPRE